MPSTTMSTNPTRDFSLSRAFGSLADTRHCAIGSHTPSTTMSTTPPMDSDLTHIKGPKRLTKRVTVARQSRTSTRRGGGRWAKAPPRLPSHSLSPRVPWRRPRVRRSRPSRLVTVSVSPRTQPTIPESAAGAGVCLPRTPRPNAPDTPRCLLFPVQV